MNRPEIVKLLATVQLGDNRNVDGLVVDYWMSLIGDLDADAAMEALRRFRRERPGVYLEPGHLLEFADVEHPNTSSLLPDLTDQVLAESKRAALAVFGVTPEQYDADESVRVDVARRWKQMEIDRG